MKSIYERILGETYEQLHPKLQQRYRLKMDDTFRGQGMMQEVSGGTLLVRLFLKLGVKYRLFFSERGKNIPFTIENTVYRNQQGKEVVTWNRTFLFPKASRHFDAIMYSDDNQQEIIDAFGKPSVLVSTLSFQVNNGAMYITPKKQWLLIFGKKISLPKWLYGQAEIIESYDEKKDCYCITVNVHNVLVGTVFAYSGTFQEVEL